METWARKTRGIHRLGIRANQPLATDVLEGTLYFVSDESILERSNGATWDSFGAIGDVVGPIASADNAITRFDGVTGKLIQDSDAFVDDNGGILERNRPVPIGEWINVTYDAGNFSAGGGGTWTVDTADQAEFTYMLIGKTLFLILRLNQTSITGVVTTLNVIIPGGFTCAVSTQQICLFRDNSTIFTPGILFVGAGNNFLTFSQLDPSAVFAVSTNATFVRATIFIPLN